MKFRISKLRIVNSGPIDDILIDFTNSATGEPLNSCLIAGANGSGKTTVCELLYETMGLFALCNTNVNSIHKKVEYVQLDLIITEENEITNLSIFYGNRPNNVIIEKEYLGFDFQTGKDERSEKARQLHRRTHDIEDAIVNCPLEINKEAFVEKNIPILIYLPYYRILEQIPDEDRSIHNENIHSKLTYKYSNTKKFKGSFESYLIWLEYSRKEEFDSIIGYLNLLFDKQKSFATNRNIPAVEVILNSGTKHRIHELSSGEQNILIMLSEIRRRLDRKGCIILIDEIENSLHPAMQNLLLNGIKILQDNTDSQFIFTTHSEELFKRFDAQHTRILTAF